MMIIIYCSTGTSFDVKWECLMYKWDDFTDDVDKITVMGSDQHFTYVHFTLSYEELYS